MSLSVSNSLGILNPASGSKATDSFHHFNRLPPEVRQIIWGFELHHERLLHVEAHPQADEDDNEKPYKIILTEYQPISKLALVCSESRAVTHRFYRVQLPCLYRWRGKQDAKGTLYFNPELDTLEIRGRCFGSFAEDLWVQDPRHMGLLNLALNQRNSVLLREISILSSLEKVLSRLRRVVFLYRAEPKCRIWNGDHRTTVPKEDPEVYRSRPVMAVTPKFDRLPCDPRSSIENCLKSVYLDSSHLRGCIYRWFRLLRSNSVQHDHEVEYTFMVAFGGRDYNCSIREGTVALNQGSRGSRLNASEDELDPEITNRDTALSWVRRKDETWRQNLRDSCKEGEEEIIEQAFHKLELPLQPAIGFWLFPIEALGPVPVLPPLPSRLPRIPWGQVSVRDRERDRKIDLSGHKPQLCLSYLP